MQTSKKFIVDLGWKLIMKELGLEAEDLLRHARLPLDLFNRQAPTLTTAEYFRVWDSLEHLMADPAFPLRIGTSISVDAFSPPIFACFCSPDLNTALARLSQYKQLIGPFQLKVDEGPERTLVRFGGLPAETPPPRSMIAMELVFLTHLARLATREQVVPANVSVVAPLSETRRYETFLGTRIQLGSSSMIAFHAADARKPFLSANASMWSIFEPELRARLSELAGENGLRDRVRSCLMELLASGRCSIGDVADRLAISTRTLQRRLNDEGTSFQQELSALRERLARHYLKTTPYSSAEISFLLGYDDPNSFFRAFQNWTGQTPERIRAGIRLQ